jgi:TRAP transporter TAXI family solute receptor
MMRKGCRWLFIGIVVLALLTAMVGCAPAGEENGEENGDEPAETVYLTFASGSVGGVYYSLGGAIADTISKVPGFQCVSESTAASIENGRLVGSGESQFGFMMSDAAYKASVGIDPFDEKLALNALFNVYPAPEHVLTLKGSGIKTIEDMKGKRVSVDAAGSGCEAMAKEILNAMDITYDDFKVAFLSQPEAATAIKDGNIDALFWNFAYPAAVVMDVASVRDIEMIPVPEEIMDQLAEEFPYYRKGKIPGGTYEGVEEDTPALEVGNVVVAHEDLDEETAYIITKTLFENIPSLGEVHPAALQMDPETAWDTPIKLHPGAERYFKEIGTLK